MSLLTRSLASQSATEKLGYGVVVMSCSVYARARRNPTHRRKLPTRRSVLRNQTGLARKPSGFRSEWKSLNLPLKPGVQPSEIRPLDARSSVVARIVTRLAQWLRWAVSYRSLRQES